ncbi:MAG: sulfotransferase [Alphaproteobacteria bacterium]|nr:sulfotransferase [Alphaproteobacteria bacterium]
MSSNASASSQLDDKRFRLILVSGAPRSGTTLLQALLCTSARAHRMTPEHKYLAGIVSAFSASLQRFESHTRFYFESRSTFLELNRRMIENLVIDAWHRVGEPEVLVLKEPALCPSIPDLLELLPRAEATVVYRDPRGIVASRIEVFRRQRPEAPIDNARVEAWARQVVDAYRPVFEQIERLQTRVHVVRYESLATGSAVAPLEAKLGMTFDQSRLWADADVPFNEERDWVTALMRGPISSSSVDRHGSILTTEQATIVTRETKELVPLVDRALNPQG